MQHTQSDGSQGAHIVSEPIDQSWQFAELVAWSCLQPQLRNRYLTEPRTVLAEFGLELGPDQPVPALPEPAGAAAVHLDPESADDSEKLQACMITYTAPSPLVVSAERAEAGAR